MGRIYISTTMCGAKPGQPTLLLLVVTPIAPLSQQVQKRLGSLKKRKDPSSFSEQGEKKHYTESVARGGREEASSRQRKGRKKGKVQQISIIHHISALCNRLLSLLKHARYFVIDHISAL